MAISAKVVADMLTTVGVHRVITMDLHADQIQGFFNIPVDNIYATPLLLGDLWKQNYDNLLVVSPDVGGVVRARAIAKRLDSELAIIDKRRPKANVAEVMNIIGDVSGRTCVIMDDIVDTANTLCKAATALKEHGAVKVVAYCTHAVLSGGAVPRIETSDIDELVVTDTIPLSPTAQPSTKIRQLSCAQLLAETMTRISNEESVSSLFTGVTALLCTVISWKPSLFPICKASASSITGASTGIGAAAAQPSPPRAAASPFITTRAATEAEAVAAKIALAGGEAHLVQRRRAQVVRLRAASSTKPRTSSAGSTSWSTTRAAS